MLTCKRPFNFGCNMDPPRTPTGRFENVCNNPLHQEWYEQFTRAYPEEIKETYKILRVNAADLKTLHEFTKTQLIKKSRFRSTKFCELCIDRLRELKQKDDSPHHEHNYFHSKRRKTDAYSNSGKKDEACIQKENVLSPRRTDTYINTGKKDEACIQKENVLSGDYLEYMDLTEIESLAYRIGKIAANSISSQQHEGLYKNGDYLQNLELNCYINTFSGVVRNFIDGLKATKRENSTDKYNKVKIHEHILHMMYPNLVLPVCFLENLLLYNKTSSRQAVDLIGAGGPHGCYDVIREWLGNQSMSQLKFPSGDCVVIFDNNQIIGRSWKIKLHNKVKSSVITTICQIEYPGYGNLQNNSHLLPKYWHLDMDKLNENVREIPEYLSNVHYRLLFASISKHLERVLEQQIYSDCYLDKIDDEVEHQISSEKSKTCQKCGYLNGKSKRLCGNDNCKANLKQAEIDSTGTAHFGTYLSKETREEKKEKHQINEIRLKLECQEGMYKIQRELSHVSEYVADGLQQHLKNGHRINPLSMSLSDPCFVNPNSFDSVRSVLRQIGLNAGIKIYNADGIREWVFVVCDGLPYGLCQQVINTTYRCRNCHITTDSFNSKEDFDKHHLVSHPDMEKAEFLEFSWVVLRPGNGHYEMNMFKSFVELNWEVFFSELCHLMGFKSENAQRAAKHCSDNHKTWSLLNIAYEGTLQELMVPYVRMCLENNRSVSPKGFLEYVLVDAKNPNYLYMATMVLTYLQAIMNMRAGLRVGNIDAITSAKSVFAPLFHSRNHPRYQEIEMADFVQRYTIPKELVDFFDETESVCLSEDKTSGEGLDFKAEVVNKDVQAWMPRGVPTGNDWLRVTRNMENLKKLGEKARNLLGSHNTNGTSKSRNPTTLDEQIFGWRACLRRKQYLSDPLNSDKKHLSLSSQELNPDLVNFSHTAEKRRQQYFDRRFDLTEKDDKDDTLPPVYVTMKERRESELITNKSKSDISGIISSTITSIRDNDVNKSLMAEFKKLGSITKCKKDDLIRFHSIVNDIVIQQQSLEDNSNLELDS